MEIDLFTFIAQIVNFIILLVLLRLVLYKPILRAMEKREARIASELEEAEQKSRRADQEAEQYRQRQEELEEKREGILARAEKEADHKRQELLQEAREEVDRDRAQWHRSLEQEKERFLSDLRRRAGQEIYRTMRRALQDLAGADLERQVIRTFTERLEHPDEEESRVLEAVARQPEEVRITSTFEVPREERGRIRQALQDHLSAADVEYERSEDLICGIELAVDHHRISWNLSNYLRSLEEELARMLEAETRKG